MKKHLRHLALCLLLVFALATSAFAAEVPESLVTENLNGQQRLVKTYILAPDADPNALKEPSFEYDGFVYTWAYTTKEDHSFHHSKTVTEIVTVETTKNDLTEILESLSPSIQYDDGEFSGELALDHTTLKTEAAGYTTKSSKVTETKVISNLDRNDLSYVPTTTVKNGRTLSLAHVDWQVTGTALVGEALVPAQYQAVATYSASSSYQVATGYITTAEYHGEVISDGIENVTYTVVYTGAPVFTEPSGMIAVHSVLIYVGAGLLVVLLAVILFMFWLRHRKNVCIYVPGDGPRDYKLVAKYRIEAYKPEIDISELDITAQVVAVEIKRSLAQKLVNKIVTVQHAYGTHRYMILQAAHDDWHEFALQEENLCDTENSSAE